MFEKIPYLAITSKGRMCCKSLNKSFQNDQINIKTRRDACHYRFFTGILYKATRKNKKVEEWTMKVFDGASIIILISQ